MAALRRSAARPGFASATATSRMHVERTRRLRAGESAVGDHRGFLPPAGRRAARAADDRRSGAHAGRTDDGLARVPGLFRAPALRARGAAIRFARRGDGAAAPRLWPRCATRAAAIVICPSNPFISIDPILAVPGVRAALRVRGAGRRGVADHRRPRGQGADGKDDARARLAGRAPARSRALRRADRRDRRRSRGRAMHASVGRRRMRHRQR